MEPEPEGAGAGENKGEDPSMHGASTAAPPRQPQYRHKKALEFIDMHMQDTFPGPPPPAAHARLVSSLESTTGIAEIATRCK